MKKIYLLLAVFATIFLSNSISFAQSGNVISIAGGSGWSAYAGDGLMATDASVRFSRTTGVCADILGNVYISDWGNYRIRKVDASSGVLTTIAGNGTAGFSGDGGPATNAQIDGMRYPMSLTIDNAGNIYYGDNGNYRVRKINTTTGIITTVAGGGSSSVNGIPATNETISPGYLYADATGNLYIGLGNEIKVVNLKTGIINAFAGKSGISGHGYSGDGGPATSAELNNVFGITGDISGNIYFADRENNRIRMVDVTGIITTFAGNGIRGYSGDGGGATIAQLNYPEALGIDAAGNIYIGDKQGKYIRKVDRSTGTISTIAGCSSCFVGSALISTPVPATSVQTVAEHLCVDLSGNIYYSTYTGWVEKISGVGSSGKISYNLSVNKNELCNGPELNVRTASYVSGLYIISDFGDGITDSSTILPGYIAGGYVKINHTYKASGSYTIRQVLYSGGLPVDTVTTPYVYTFCRSIPVQFYHDGNGNCIKDGSEPAMILPSVTEVDSNGIHVATISATSGINYSAYGQLGDVYSFKLITVPSGLNIACPSTGIWAHTISTAAIAPDYIGYNCSSTPGFDLEENVSVHCGFHFAIASIILNNKYCTPQNAMYTLHFSPKYAFSNAQPTPASVSGSTISWNIASLSSITSAPVNINVSFNASALKIGDTVRSEHTVDPFPGDKDTSNNHCHRQDTIKSSFDPNQVTVSPAGNILSCTQLHYTVEFENTGNDTAHNIYVMDTLPDGVDISSMRIVAASAAMNITMLKYSGHNIARFDFPNINLLDSSHHNQCHGMVIYNINAKPGLPDGTLLPNYAGIFFDDNEVVMTNTAINTIGIQPINGGITVCAGLTDTLTNATAGGVWAASNSNATVTDGVVTGVTAGLDTISYTVSNSCTAQTKTKIITIGAVSAAPITGAANVCLSSSAMLTDASTGGVWSSSNTTVATVSTSGLVSGLITGTTTVSYAVTNSCGTATATKKMTVSTLPLVYSVTGGGDVCIGSTGKHIFLSGSESGAEYQLYNGASPVGALVTGTGALLDMGVYTAAGIYSATADYISTACTSAMTGSALINPIAVVVPLVDISSVTSDTLCADAKKTLLAGSFESGTAPVYTWYVNGMAAATGLSYTYTPADGDRVKVVMKSNAVCAIPDTAISTKMLTVIATPVPVVAITQSPAGITKKGEPVTFTAAVTGGGTAPAYQWSKNGKLITGATLAAYTENSLADKDVISCSVTGTDLCGSNTSSASATVGVSSLGVNIQYANTSFAVYPNPANDELTIDADKDVFKSCSITNSIGQEMMQQTITTTKTNLNIKALPAGLYYVTLKGDNGIKVQKFVKL
ncbi:MAG: C-terminal target protein [Flavipsychrobacter sp.]|nr:C-terminal target protein [Flavipsychrobacter sp.]